MTAGPAWGHFNTSVQAISAVRTHSVDDSWHPGIAAGAGLEFQLAAHWNLRAEYLYLDFVDKTVAFDATDGGINPISRTTFSNSAQLARIGLSYRPGDWIVSKY